MFKVTITGHCGSDGELRFTDEGRGLVTVNVAVNTRRQNKDKEWIDHTDWIRVRTMRGAESLAPRLLKGTRVIVIGDIQTGEYTAKDGTKRFSLDIWADIIETVREKPAEEQNGKELTGVSQRAALSSRTSAPADPADDNDDDALPF